MHKSAIVAKGLQSRNPETFWVKDVVCFLERKRTERSERKRTECPTLNRTYEMSQTALTTFEFPSTYLMYLLESNTF